MADDNVPAPSAPATVFDHVSADLVHVAIAESDDAIVDPRVGLMPARWLISEPSANLARVRHPYLGLRVHQLATA
jgi:hypothetical protein